MQVEGGWTARVLQPRREGHDVEILESRVMM